MNAAVFGASGGIGGAITRALIARGGHDNVFALSRKGETIPGAVALKADALDEEALGKAAQVISEKGPLHLCIVAIAVLTDGAALQPERSYRQQSMESFERVFKINCFGPALIAKHILPLMPRNEPASFAALSARVGSIADNRLGGWHAYRASKAALNMLIKNYALEQAARNKDFIAVGLHPGTVDTGLSKPFQKNVPGGQLFSPAHAASCLLNVLDRLSPEDSGKVFDWAGRRVPA